MSKSSVVKKGPGVKSLRKLAESLEIELRVGVFEAQGSREGGDGITNVELGIIHEFGSPSAGIPARYWLSGPARYFQNAWVKLYEKAIKKVLSKKLSAEAALSLVGERAAADVRKGITGGVGLFPPDAPATIAAKGSSRPLVNTGQFVNSITYVVVKK